MLDGSQRRIGFRDLALEIDGYSSYTQAERDVLERELGARIAWAERRFQGAGTLTRTR